MLHVLTEPVLTTIPIKRDARGWLAEILKPENLTRKSFGQISVTVPRPNESKGNHYHKYRVEWFIVLKGKVKFDVMHIKTRVKKVFILTGDTLQSLRISPFWHHCLKNIGNEDAIILLYYNRAFDLSKPDTFTLEGRKKA